MKPLEAIGSQRKKQGDIWDPKELVCGLVNKVVHIEIVTQGYEKTPQPHRM